ncbi:MAG: IS982 family transposase, partial [Tannerella sp.]|nr:IS982 family transposase [Tannerella sp.]
HRSLHNFIMNLIAAIGAYCFFEKKPSIPFDREKPTGQLELFY